MSANRVGSAVSSFLGFGSRGQAESRNETSPQPPPALPRSNASSADHTLPAASAPVKPAVAAAAFNDPLVRTRPEKYGGAVATDATQGTGCPGPVEIAVKAHTRTVPAMEKSLIPESVTIEGLVAEYRKLQRITTQRVLLLGALSEHWIREQLRKGTALDRATAVKKIRAELAAAKLEKKEARVDLYIRCYWVAAILGGYSVDSQDSRQAANELAFSALRLFPVLFERDRASDRWRLIGAYAEAAKALWVRAIAEKLPAKIVDAEISKILPARTVSIRKHRPIRLSVIERLLARVKPEELPKVHGLVDKVTAKLNSTAAA